MDIDDIINTAKDALSKVSDEQIEGAAETVKDKVPEHAWWEDEVFGRVPTEVMLLSLVNHENIVRCLDLFEDEVYFYLVGGSATALQMEP